MSGKRLLQLVENQRVAPGDSIFFDFKGNHFSAHFSEGGILHDCWWKNGSGEAKQIFKNRTFVTLSDWTESCIQDMLQEYSTRYSSWKRVTHTNTGKTLDEIWKGHMEQRLKSVKKPTVTQLRQLNERLMEKLAKAKEKIKDPSSAQDGDTAAVRPILMNSPHGTYMVLQRMLNTGNPAIDDVKQMDMGDFRQHLKTFTQTQKVVEAGNCSDEWYQNILKGKKDVDIAKFVYNFFKKGGTKRVADAAPQSHTSKKIKQ